MSHTQEHLKGHPSSVTNRKKRDGKKIFTKITKKPLNTDMIKFKDKTKKIALRKSLHQHHKKQTRRISKDKQKHVHISPLTDPIKSTANANNSLQSKEQSISNQYQEHLNTIKGSRNQNQRKWHTIQEESFHETPVEVSEFLEQSESQSVGDEKIALRDDQLFHQRIKIHMDKAGLKSEKEL